MRNELADRQQAIRLRLAGDTVPLICQILHRSEAWVQKWWHRYLAAGGDGLYDLTRARHHVVNRTPAHIERAILAIRRRLAARATAETRYTLIGAPTIQQELKSLGYTPIPTLRTIDRVLQRAHLTSPRLRLARRLPGSAYPGPQAEDSNHVHQVDLVGPRYLHGDKTKYYFCICKDAFDQAVYAEFHAGSSMAQVLPFLVRAWQQLGLPQQVQFDNGRQFYAPGRYARSLNRVIRLALRLSVQPVFIPEARPERNGSVENFNGWFQPLLLRQTFPNARAVRRELRRLVLAANEHHVHQGLGFQTPMQFRRGKRLRKLPADFVIDFNHIPVAVGKIMFIRWVPPTGYIDILGESVKVGRRLRHHYVKVLLETHPQRLRVYCNGRLIAQRPFKLRIP
jgi:transposase InsO family protein